ncbi:MAG: hypothetical protein CMA34_06655 [Euryarchaeota archaeon]|nr:hypothetical protein [Euryarchaeota archaeon]
MSIYIDWARNPIIAKSQDEEKLSEFLIFLNKYGIKKHSIVMPDRETGGFILFLYQKIDEEIIDKWNEVNE